MGHSQSSVMARSVDSAMLSVPTLSKAESSEVGSLPTLSSGSSEEESSSETRSAHPSDTSYGLSSLESRVDGFGFADYVNLRPADEDFLKGARNFVASQPVFKKKLKMRVTRRMQVVVRSRVGYTQLRREVNRRKDPIAFSIDVPSISGAFAQLSLRPEKAFAGKKKNESAV